MKCRRFAKSTVRPIYGWLAPRRYFQALARDLLFIAKMHNILSSCGTRHCEVEKLRSLRLRACGE